MKKALQKPGVDSGAGVAGYDTAVARYGAVAAYGRALAGYSVAAYGRAVAGYGMSVGWSGAMREFGGMGRAA